MPDFHFYHPIEVRYGDLDPQGHVNNAKYLTYMEQARVAYLRHLGLWEGGSFLEIGIILADAHITFRAPIQFGAALRVGMRIARLGNKSVQSEYRIEEAADGREYASGASVLVAYDYQRGQTVVLPEAWREKIAEFEGLTQAG